jgi:hypothetical protein
MAEVKLITQSEYARHRGCSPVAVLKAIRSGRITTVERDGQTWIDPDVADIQWAKNSRPRVRNLPAPPPLELLSPPEAQLYDIQAARAKREHHEANLADLKEQRAVGALLDRSRVQKAVVDATARLRGDLEQIPGKLSAQLAAETEVTAIRALLTTAIHEALGNLADGLRRMAASAEEASSHA